MENQKSCPTTDCNIELKKFDTFQYWCCTVHLNEVTEDQVERLAIQGEASLSSDTSDDWDIMSSGNGDDYNNLLPYFYD